MSSPIRKTRSSRAISSTSASRRAARNSRSAIAAGLPAVPLAGIEVAVQLVHRRVRALVREADRLVDLGRHLGLQALQVVGADDAGLLEPVGEAGDGVGSAPPLLLLVRP